MIEIIQECDSSFNKPDSKCVREIIELVLKDKGINDAQLSLVSLGNSLNSRKDRFDKSDIIEQSIVPMGCSIFIISDFKSKLSFFFNKLNPIVPGIKQEEATQQVPVTA